MQVQKAPSSACSVVAFRRSSPGIKGLYRLPSAGVMADMARVDTGVLQVSVPRTLYEERGFQPPFETLPTQDDLLGSVASILETSAPS